MARVRCGLGPLRCWGAVDCPGAQRAAGPVIRACLYTVDMAGTMAARSVSVNEAAMDQAAVEIRSESSLDQPRQHETCSAGQQPNDPIAISVERARENS